MPEMLLIFGVMIAAMYFLMIRPQKKRQQEQQEKIAALGEGSRVMLTSGIFATIKHIGDKQAVVELAPGVEATVLRQAIMREATEDEDEFEYDDDTVSASEEDLPQAEADSPDTGDTVATLDAQANDVKGRQDDRGSAAI